MFLENKNLFVRAKSSKTPTWFWKGEMSLHITSKLINELENYSDSFKTNCRICIHTSPQELCHVMLIVERKGMNIAPHKHFEKSDFVYIIKGEMEFIEFNNNGSKIKNITLNQFEGYKPLEGSIHAIGILSNSCTYLETSTGPWLPKSDTQYLEWSDKWHKQYLKKLSEDIK